MAAHGSTPSCAIAALAGATEIALVPIGGAPIEPLRRRYPYFSVARIAGAEYKGVVDTPAPGPEWVRRLEELEALARDGDGEAVVAALRDLVPTYQPDARWLAASVRARG